MAAAFIGAFNNLSDSSVGATALRRAKMRGFLWNRPGKHAPGDGIMIGWNRKADTFYCVFYGQQVVEKEKQ